MVNIYRETGNQEIIDGLTDFNGTVDDLRKILDEANLYQRNLTPEGSVTMF